MRPNPPKKSISEASCESRAKSPILLPANRPRLDGCAKPYPAYAGLPKEHGDLRVVYRYPRIDTYSNLYKVTVTSEGD